MAILIKRYANRKLYNTDSSRYITLKGIAKLLEDGEEVRVMDNETGEDITQVALSQILVDSQRSKETPNETLLSQLLARGGDALYGAIRRSVDDATEGLGDFQDRFRRMVDRSESTAREGGRPERSEEASAERGLGATIGELESFLRKTITETIDAYALPRRRDVERLTRQLERVALAVERLEEAFRDQDGDEDTADARGEAELAADRWTDVRRTPGASPDPGPERTPDSNLGGG